MIKNLFNISKNLYGYGKNSYKKKGTLSLEMVITFVILAVLLGVMLWLIYEYIVNKMGKDTIGTITDDTKDNSDSVLTEIFKPNKPAIPENEGTS